MKKSILFIFLSFFAVACTDSDHHSSSVSNLPHDTDLEIVGEYELNINNNAGSITFEIPGNTSAFQLITKINGQAISVQKIKDPNNHIIFTAESYYSPYLTDGQEYQNNMNVFNFPVSPKTNILEQGKYTAYFRTNDSKGSASGSSILLIKKDSNPDYGTVQLNIVFAGSVANDTEVKKSVKDALEKYSLKTLSKAGIKANVKYYAFPTITPDLPDPRNGNSLFMQVSSRLPNGINLIMGSKVAGLNKGAGHSGISASVPGPAIPSEKSAICFSMAVAVGSDGVFNGSGVDSVNGQVRDWDEGDEVKLLSDSISHEVFHYLGLRNSVEFSGNIVVWGDGLNSAKCEVKERCENLKSTRENVMYPYPIKHNSTSYDRDYYWYVRNKVSSDQRKVANKWVGVN